MVLFEQEKERIDQGVKGIYISLTVYIVMAMTKIGTGLLAGSQALVADGWNNTSDVFSSLAILVGLFIAKKPADHDHRYGHYRAQTAAALVAALFMGIVGVDVLQETIRSMFSDNDVIIQPEPIALYVAGASAIVMYIVYRINHRIGVRTNNLAVLAAAYDNRSDALVSLGTLVGIGVAKLGWGWADPVVAILVGLIILKTAWEVGFEAVHALMDGFEAEKLEAIEDKIKQIDGVEEVKDLRARYQGSAIHVDATIGVDANLTVVESHQLTEHVEEQLVGSDGIERVYVHVEPVEADKNK